jgi:hypothetical protein
LFVRPSKRAKSAHNDGNGGYSGARFTPVLIGRPPGSRAVSGHSVRTLSRGVRAGARRITAGAIFLEDPAVDYAQGELAKFNCKLTQYADIPADATQLVI